MSGTKRPLWATQADILLDTRLPREWFLNETFYLAPYLIRKGFFGNFIQETGKRLPLHAVLRVLNYAGYSFRIEEGFSEVVIDKRLGLTKTEKTHDIVITDGENTFKLFFHDLWQFILNSTQAIVYPEIIPWKVPKEFDKKVGRTAKKFFFAPFENPGHFLACIVKRKTKCVAIFNEHLLPNTIGRIMEVKFPKGLPEGVYFGFVDVLFKEVASLSDCLFFDGKDITGETFATRYSILQKILPDNLLFFKKAIRTIKLEGVYMDAESKGHSVNGLYLFRKPRQRRLPCVYKQRVHYYNIAGDFIVEDYTGVLLTIPKSLFNNGDDRFVDHLAFVTREAVQERNKDKIQGFQKGEKGKVETLKWVHPLIRQYKTLSIKRGPEWSKWLVRRSRRKKRSPLLRRRPFLTASLTNTSGTLTYIMYRYRKRGILEPYVTW